MHAMNSPNAQNMRQSNYMCFLGDLAEFFRGLPVAEAVCKVEGVLAR